MTATLQGKDDSVIDQELWTTFDPLWSLQTGSVMTDPAAGAWFPAQALQLAQNANPQLSH